jgi:hypothetical protein
VLLVTICHQEILAEKIDIIILTNGDHLSGEVKRMEYAQVEFKTDAMSTIYIDWHEVKFIRSHERFRTELSNGYHFYGSLDTDTLRSQLIIVFDSLTYKASFSDVLGIIPIKDTFLKRLKLKMDLGFSYTKGSNIGQFSSNLNSSYRSLMFLHRLTFDFIITSQQDTLPAQNLNLAWSTSRFFLYRWFYVIFTGIQKNTKLGLKMRLLFGAGGGKDLLHDNLQVLTTAGGLQVTEEWRYNQDPLKKNLEGVITLRYSRFRYQHPKLDLDTDFKMFPNLTTKGRIRYEFNISLSWEIFADFYWEISFYNNYDNKGDSDSSAKNDYGTTISFGWTY